MAGEVLPTGEVVPVTPRKVAEMWVAAVLGILQALSLTGVGVGTLTDKITTNQVIICGLLSSAIGVVQMFLTSVRARKMKATVTQ